MATIKSILGTKKVAVDTWVNVTNNNVNYCVYKLKSLLKMSGSWQERKAIGLSDLNEVAVLKAKDVNSERQRQAAAILDFVSAADVRKASNLRSLKLGGAHR